MLSALHLKNFKSFADQAVRLAPLTVLVGANASGKSNFLDAIRFHQGVGLDMPLSEILLGRWEGGRQVWPGVRGGAAETARAGTDAFLLNSAWNAKRAGRSKSGVTLAYQIECAIGAYPQVRSESLSARTHAGYLFDTHAATLRGKTGPTSGGSIRVAAKAGDQGNSPTAEYAASRPLLGQIAQVPMPRAAPVVALLCERLMATMRAAVFLDIAPTRMRDYRPQQARELGAHGDNISPVLLEYCRNSERKAELIDWVSELCAPPIEDIRFDETRLQEVMLELVEAGGVAISARSLSDGTLRFLGIVAALLTAPAGSMLLIEEVENGLHPTRAHLLVELLEQTTRDRGIQVIATTHSPQLLEGLSPDALGNTVVFGRVPDEPGSVARRLKDLAGFDAVAARRGVDELFATGWLERAL